ncbi:MAG: TetR/AcrR family transcriptional regulator [bacterium]|nr:TetR/AcrR family transcriptional regulator [bacterium]
MSKTNPASAPATGRAARRRERTRAKLLVAAHAVIARKGTDATTIQQITEEADVGFGPFYNYFASKEAIIEAMISEAEETFANTLDQISDAVEDSAEVVAASVRFLMERVIDEPDWGHFLLHTRLSVAHLETGFGARLVRDVRVGMEAGRFHIEDPEATLFAVGGTVFALIAACLDGVIEVEAPERTATLALNLLGIPNPEASEVAHRPLPPLEFS